MQVFCFCYHIAMKKGIFIVFEGPDRSGKTTQIKLLTDWLNKKKIKTVLTREPGGTGVSEAVRAVLLNPKSKISPLTELFLYESARAQHTEEIILPALKAGKTVISDRFTMATVAYQGYGRGLDLSMIKTLNDIATAGIKPDLSFVFTMPDSEFFKRGKNLPSDRMERQKASFRLKVNRAYRELANKPGCVKIDATHTIEAIHAEITGKLTAKLKL